MHTLKKVGKIFLYIILGLVILLFVAGLFIDPIAKRIMIKQVDKAAGGQYSLALDDVDISILAGNVSLTGVVLETDTTDPDVPPMAFLKADEITVKGVSWLTYLLDSRLSMDRVYFNKLNVQLLARTIDSTQQQTKEEKPFRLQQLDIYPAIKEQVDRFHLKDLTLDDISLTLVNLSSQDTLLFRSKELNLKSDDILIDADKLITDNRAFYTTEMDFAGKEVSVIRNGSKSLVVEADYIKFETLNDQIGLLTQGVNYLQTDTLKIDTLMSVAFKEFLVSSPGMKKIQEDSVARIEKISMDNITIVNNFPADPDTSLTSSAPKQQQQQSLAKMSMGGSLPEFIRRVELKELDLNSISYHQGTSVLLKGANLNADNMVIDQNSAFSSNRFFHAQAMESSFNSLAVSLGQDSVYLTVADFEFFIEDGIGRLGIEEIKLKPAEKGTSAMWVDAELGAFSITGINTTSIVPDNKLVIDSIAFATPKVAFHLPQQQSGSQAKSSSSAKNKGSQSQPTDLSLYPVIEGMLESLYVRKFALVDGQIKALGLTKDLADEVLIPNIYLQISDVLIAKGTAFSEDRVLHSDDIALRVENIFVPMDGLYTAKLDLFRLSTSEKFVEARKFLFDYTGEDGTIPIKADTNFIISVKNDHLLVDQIDWQDLIHQQKVNIGLIRTEGLDLFFFSDENKGSSSKNSSSSKSASETPGASMPQKAIKQIDMPLYIGKFELDRGKITYKELAKGAEEAGEAKVTDISVTAANITNIPWRLRRDPILPIEISGKLMGSGDFYTDIRMDMVSDSSLVTFTGQLDTFQITKMNQFTEYTSRIGFESGKIYTLGWDIEADEELAKGTLKMSYDNLDIRISESNNPNTSGILKNVGSFLANKLVLESDVAESSKKPEKAEFEEEREGEDFPTYLIQGLVSGFMELMVTIF